MGEGGGGSGGSIGFVAEVHGCDEAVFESENVEDFAVEEDIPLKALDELVDADAELTFGVGGDRERFDVGIELGPLASPVGADLFFANDLAALGGFGPGDVFGHEGEGCIDVAVVECGVREVDGGGRVGHGSLLLRLSCVDDR